MQRPQPVDEFQNSIDKVLALSIVEAAQRHAAAQMSVIVGITSRTPQWALTGNLDRERGAPALEDLSPRMKYFGSFQEKPFFQSGRKIRPGKQVCSQVHQHEYGRW